MSDQVQQLDINLISSNPLQPRGEFAKSELEELKQSIVEHGIIEPLVIAQTPAGLQLIAGERRLRAAKLAGLTTVPVIIKKTTPRGMLEMALIENVQRVDLNALERGKAFQRLITEFRLTSADISRKIGKSTAFISNSLRLLQLPDAIKDGLIGGVISEGHARALAAIEDPRLMVEAYKVILKENGSVRRAEALARMMKEQMIKTPKMEKKDLQPVIHSQVDDWQKKLQEAFGPHSSVRMSQSSRQTKVYITLKGSPAQTAKELEKILALTR